MNLVNLAHGSLYMVGAYATVAAIQWTGSYVGGVALGLLATLAIGMATEVDALRTLSDRDHLAQVLATFGLILYFNEMVAIIFGRTALYMSLPKWLQGHIEIIPGSIYPLYRAAVIVLGLAVAGGLWYVVARTRLGMLIRAGASNRAMVAALGIVLGLVATLAVGMATEVIALRTLYDRDHLDQVLATFGLILFFNEAVAMLFGRTALYMSLPKWLQGHIEIIPGSIYPVYRAAVIVVGLAVAGGLWYVVARTRLGMLIRAGASNRAMVAALGVNIRLLYTVVFGFGAALAGLAGLMAGPIYAVQPGMGDLILIQVFVVIVIGGIGSIRGAFVGALIVGIVDTLGRAFLKPLLGQVISGPAAEAAGPALASMLIYLLMAVVLAVKPAGLFSNR
jgi:branched-chain amino acid transport system permease protein